MPIKNTIANLLGLHNTEGEYGVEIEAEGHNLPTNLDRNFWRTDIDGSLKSGFAAFEYVMPLPLNLKGVRKSLDYLAESYKDNMSEVIDTIMSGVHVHVNVQQFTMKQLYTFITMYFVLDELLVNFCGPSRQGNHFCLRAKDAEWIIHELLVSAKTKNLKNLNTENIRYCTCNLFSLFKYGSVEFRAMRGTGDLDTIYDWVCILDKVKNASLKFNNPRDVIVAMSDKGERNFIKFVLGDYAEFFLNVEKWDEMVREGIYMVQPLAFSIDWNSFKDENINPFKKDFVR